MLFQTIGGMANRKVQNLFTHFPKRCRSSFSLNHVGKIHIQLRGYQTSLLHMNKNEDPKVNTKVFTVTNPLKYISLKFKIFLLRGYFDEQFDEAEFLAGARQAVIHVSGKLAKGELQSLNDVFTQGGMKCAQKLLAENKRDRDKLKVDEENIMTLNLNDIGFEYGESGKKWAYALVIYYCSGKDSFSKQSSEFNFEILTSQPRIIKYSFCREFTPGCTEGWLVDNINHTNLDIYRD